MSGEFEQHCCEPANDNAHAGALAGEDGQFPPSPPIKENLKMKKLILIFWAALAAGCNSMPKVNAANEPTGIGNTTILRNYNYYGSSVRYWPMIDGKVISGIFRNQYVSFDLTAGEHVVGVGCCQSPWIYSNINVTVAEGVRRYFLISPAVLQAGFAEIEEISKEEATTRIAQSERITTGFISDCDGKSVEATNNAPWVCFSMIKP